MKHLTPIIVLASMLLAACGGAEALTAEDILNNAAEATATIETVEFEIARDGSPIVIDPEANLAILGATGAYEAPDSVYAAVRVGAGTIITEGEVLWIADGVFLRLPPLFPEFEPIEVGDTFNATRIFDPEQGVPAVLTDGLTDPTLVGEEEIDGIPTYHVTGTAEAETITDIVGGGLETDQTVTVDLWIDRGSFEVVRLLVTEDDEETWTLDFFNYGGDVEIPTP
ncbi:MAG: LppX_LprAFG lipoprotein [Anaerolineae bacterium]